jgi:hypothetical protein
MPPTAFLTATRVEKPPVLDARMDESVWARAQVANHFVHCAKLARTRTVTRVLYDEKHLYLGFVCFEPKINALKAGDWGPDGPVWRDHCLEFFIDPETAGQRYYHFAVNSKGVIYDADQKDKSWNANGTAAVWIGSDRWQVVMAVPCASLGLERLVEGGKLGINFCRTNIDLRDPDTRHSAWADYFEGYHEPERFGRLGFALAPPRIELVTLGQRVVGPNRAVLSLKNVDTSDRRLRMEVALSGAMAEQREINLAPGMDVETTFDYEIHSEEETVNMVISVFDLIAGKEALLWRSANLPARVPENDRAG